MTERRRQLSKKVVKHLNWYVGGDFFTRRQNECTTWGMIDLPGSGRATHQAVTQEISAP